MIDSKPILTVTRSGGVMTDYTFVCDTGKNLMTLKERSNMNSKNHYFYPDHDYKSLKNMYTRKISPICEFKNGPCSQVVPLISTPLVPTFDFCRRIIEDEMNDARM